MESKERKIHRTGNLLHGNGTLKKIGYSKKFLREYNKSVLLKLKIWSTVKTFLFLGVFMYILNIIFFQFFDPESYVALAALFVSNIMYVFGVFVYVKLWILDRVKEWEYYLIMNQEEEIAVGITIADLGYLRLGSYVFIDFRKEKFFVKEEISVIPNIVFPSVVLPRRSEPKEGKESEIVSEFNGRNMLISVKTSLDEESGEMKRDVYVKGVGDSNDIVVVIRMKYTKNQDSMCIATSWKENRKCFYYNHKINCMATIGFVEFKGQKYFFKKSEDGFNYNHSVLDWGRGIWTYQNKWYWSSLSCTLKNGDKIGWNLGYGFSDRSKCSENMVFYNSEGSKLGKVEFVMDKKSENRFMSEWILQSTDSERFYMKFTPVIDRNQDANFVLVRSYQHQVFGRFTGYFVLDDGKKIEIKDKLGFAEEVYNRW